MILFLVMLRNWLIDDGRTSSLEVLETIIIGGDDDVILGGDGADILRGDMVEEMRLLLMAGTATQFNADKIIHIVLMKISCHYAFRRRA